MELSQRIAKNTFFLGLTEIFQRLSSFVIIPVAARILGPEDFGLFNFAVSFIAIFAILYDFGINLYLIRDIAADRSRSYKYFATALPLRIVIGFASTIIIVGVSVLAGYEKRIIFIIGLLSIGGIFNSISSLIDSFFRGFERMEFIGKIRGITSLIRMVLCISILLLGGGIMGFAYAQLFTAISATIIYLIVLSKASLFEFSISFDFTFWRKFIKSSLPFALVAASIAFYNNINMVIMKQYLSLEQIGFYSAAYKFMPLMVTIPAIFNSALMPAMANINAQSQETLKKIYSTSIRILFTPSLLISLLAIIFAPFIINIIFGNQYQPAITPFRILFLTFPVIAISSLGGNLLFIKSPKTNLLITGGIMVPSCIILNYLLIPEYGIIGAATAIALNEYLGSGLGQFFAWKLSGKPNFGYLKSVILPLIIAVVLGIPALLLKNVAVLVVIVLLFILIIIKTGIYSKEDLSMALNAIRPALIKLKILDS